MAITFVGSMAPVGANNGGNVTLTFTGASGLLDTTGAQATLQQGDLVVVVGSNSIASDFAMATSSTGWTNQGETYANGSTYDTNIAVWTKVMGATPDTSMVITGPGGAANANIGTAFAFRNVDTTTPMDVTAVTATGTGTSAPDAGSITPSTAGAWIVVCGAGSAAAGAAFTNPGDLSTTTNHFRSSNHAETNDCAVGCGIKTNWTSGAFDPSAWTGGNVNAANSWAAVTLALRPSIINGSVNKTLDGVTLSSAGVKDGLGDSISLSANGAGISATLNNGVYTITTTSSSVAGSSYVGSASDVIPRNYVMEVRVITHANGVWAGMDNAAPAAWGSSNMDEALLPDAGFGAGKINYVKNGTFTVQDVAYSGYLFLERVGTTVKVYQGADWPTARGNSPIITSTAVDDTARGFQFGIDSSGLVSEWQVRVVEHPYDREGTVSKTLDALTLTSSGGATTAISGSVSKTLDATTVTSSAKLQVKGTLSKTLDAATATSAGKVSLKATVAKTLDTVVATSAAKIYLKGSVSATLGAVTSSSQGAVALKGIVSKTLSEVVSSASADLVIKGSTSRTLDEVVLDAEGGSPPPISGTVNRTLDALTTVSASDLVVQGTLSKTLDGLLSSSFAALIIKGSLSKTLDTVVLSSFIKPFTNGQTTKTLENVTSNSGSKLKVTASVTKTLETVSASFAGSITGEGSPPPVVLPPSTSVSLRRHELRGDLINAYKAYKIIARSKRGH